MRRILVTAVLAALSSFLAPPRATGAEVPAKYRGIVAAIKANAASTPGLITHIPQGTIYFKWLQSPPGQYEKAYFKLGEIDKGSFLSLQLIKHGGAGVELLELIDEEPMNGVVEAAYRGSGRTLPDADRVINANLKAAKVTVTPEMQTNFREGLDELRFELGVK